MRKEPTTLSPNRSIFEKLRDRKSQAVVALAAFVLSACGNGETTTKAVDPDPTKTAETPSATTSVEPVTESTPTENSESTPTQSTETREQNMYDATTLSEQEVALVETMDGMSLQEFEAAPLSDRIIYYLGKDHEAQSNFEVAGYFADFTGQTFANGESLASYSPVIRVLNEHSSNDDILRSITYREQLMQAWAEDTSQRATDNTPRDKDTAAKLVSSLALEGTDQYAAYMDSVNSEPIVTQIPQENVANTTTSEQITSDVITSPIDQSTTAVTRTFEVTLGDVPIPQTFVFLDLSKQLGPGNGIWMEYKEK